MKVGVFYWHTKQTQQWNLSEKTVDAANPANHWCLPSSRLNPHTASTCCCGCSVTESRPTLCDPMDCRTPGFPVLYYVQEVAQTHVHSVSDAIRPSHSLPPLFLHTFNFSQYQGLSQWVGFLHQVAKILEPQLHTGPSNEHSGLISSRIDELDLLAVQGTLRSLLQDRNLKALILQCSAFFMKCIASHKNQ